ncbi:hypothetical protein FRC03_011348 [Tulasnella sp. 419]|nr:hypothetical protein FRC03_011348 [Tulasnella sp. 419]
MSSTFTPSDAIDVTKEKDWPYQLALLDWDSTKIVFTKRQLIEFLKYAGVTVDTNLTNIQKLPRYAQFGKLSAGAPAPSGDSTAASNPATQAAASAASARPTAPSSSGFIPSRRVREAPGGFQHDIFGADEEEEPKSTPAAANRVAEEESNKVEEPRQATSAAARRHKNEPSLGLNMFVDQSGQSAFKPTRRVRDAPGGHDQLHDMFS